MLESLAGGKTPDIDNGLDAVSCKDFRERFDGPITGADSIYNHIHIITDLQPFVFLSETLPKPCLSP
jgi:hypothetical protein